MYIPCYVVIENVLFATTSHVHGQVKIYCVLEMLMIKLFFSVSSLKIIIIIILKWIGNPALTKSIFNAGRKEKTASNFAQWWHWETFSNTLTIHSCFCLLLPPFCNCFFINELFLVKLLLEAKYLLIFIIKLNFRSFPCIKHTKQRHAKLS